MKLSAFLGRFVSASVTASALCFGVEAQLPPVQVPAGNPITADKVNLGKVLFWDEQMSSTRTVACGTCHMPDAGGGDPRTSSSVHPGPDGVVGTADDVHGSPGLPLSLADGTYIKSSFFGLDTQVTGRIAPTVINAAFSRFQFWDGRAVEQFDDPMTGATLLATKASLESQAANPPVGDAEMAHQGRDWGDVAERIARSKPLALATDVPAALEQWIGTQSYQDLFTLVFGTPNVSPARILMAIATYERTLISDQTPFDLFNLGIPNALTPLENTGMNVFNGVGRCNTCHAGPLMRNQNFANIGWRPSAEDPGRSAVTGDPNDLGKFKIPGLRNVGLRDAFFHNGGAKSLEEVIELYDIGGEFLENLDPLMQSLSLSQSDKDALAAFLKTGLTDPRVTAKVAPFDRPTLYSERSDVPQTYGAGVPGAGNFVPRLLGIEPAMLGNPNFTLTLADGRGMAPAVIVFDVAADTGGNQVLGVPLWIAGTGALFALPIPALLDSGDGEGYWSGSIAIANNASYAGVSIYAQAFVADDQAALGMSGSAGLSFTLFPPR